MKEKYAMIEISDFQLINMSKAKSFAGCNFHFRTSISVFHEYPFPKICFFAHNNGNQAEPPSHKIMENCCVFWGVVRIWFFSKVLHPNVTVFFPVCNAGSSLITMILAEVILCRLRPNISRKICNTILLINVGGAKNGLHPFWHIFPASIA